jgi:hypothetical protein
MLAQVQFEGTLDTPQQVMTHCPARTWKLCMRPSDLHWNPDLRLATRVVPAQPPKRPASAAGCTCNRSSTVANAPGGGYLGPGRTLAVATTREWPCGALPVRFRGMGANRPIRPSPNDLGARNKRYSDGSCLLSRTRTWRFGGTPGSQHAGRTRRRPTRGDRSD